MTRYSPAVDSDPKPPRDFYLAMWTLVFAEVFATLEGNMLLSAIPTIARELGSLDSAMWLMTAYLLIASCTAVVASRLGDMYGRELVLLVLVLVCIFGSVLSANATDIVMMVIGRGFQGVSGAILPLCFGIVRASASSERAPYWMGMLVAAMTLSAAVGYVLGGAFADHGAWRLLFWVTAIAASVLSLAIWKFLDVSLKSANTGQRVDWIGLILLVAALLLIMLGIPGLSPKAPSGNAIPLIFGGLAVLVAWIAHQLKTDQPLVDLRLLAIPNMAVANLGFALLGLGALQLGVLIMLVMQQPTVTGIGLGVTATSAAFLKLPSNVISSVAGPGGGVLCKHIGGAMAMMIGALVLVLGWTGLWWFSSDLWLIVVFSIICVAGTTLVMVAVPVLILGATPVARSSEAVASAMVVRGIFSSIGMQVVATSLASASVLQGDARYPAPAAYDLAFVFVILANFSIFLLGATLTWKNRGADHAHQHA